MAKPISLAQEVRASPTNPSSINTSLRHPQAPRAAPMAPPREVNRGTFQRAPVAAILQGGGMNGFGAAPIPLGQPAMAALMNPNAVNQSLRRPQAARGAPMAPPREVNRGTFQRVPVQAILQGGGMNGVPLQVTNINGAPLAVAPINSGGGLGAMNSDMSVSAQQRAAKAIKAGGPIVGDYTDAIRNAAGFAFGPKRMPGQGFAAANYAYPSQQMVIGATLSGNPIVAPPARAPMPNRASPMFATKGGGTIRGQISSSPSEDRRRLLSTLMGLSAAQFPDTPKYAYADSDWFKNTPAGSSRPDNNGRSCYRSVSGDADANQTFASECTLSAAAAASWAKYCNDTYGGEGGNVELQRLCKIVPEYLPSPPWSESGKLLRGLPNDWKKLVKEAETGVGDAKKQACQLNPNLPGCPKAPGAGGGAGAGGTLPGGGRTGSGQAQTRAPQKDNTLLIVGGSVAALATLGVVAAYVASKKK